MSRLLLLLSIVASMGCASIRSSPSSIEQSLLRRLPAEATIDDVHRLAAAEDWEISDGASTDRDVTAEHWPYAAGDQLLIVSMGEYGWPFIKSVSSFWGFSDSGELLNLYVRKVTDGL